MSDKSWNLVNQYCMIRVLFTHVLLHLIHDINNWAVLKHRLVFQISGIEGHIADIMIIFSCHLTHTELLEAR